MRYQNCIFDLYGTLVDIHTDETSPRLWVRMAGFYRRRGADQHPSRQREFLRQPQRHAQDLLRGDD